MRTFDCQALLTATLAALAAGCSFARASIENKARAVHIGMLEPQVVRMIGDPVGYSYGTLGRTRWKELLYSEGQRTLRVKVVDGEVVQITVHKQ